MNTKGLILVAVLAVSMTASSLQTAATDEYLFYVGTHTRKASKGVYAFRFQPSSGSVVPIGPAAEVGNPSFLAVHPNRRTCIYRDNHTSPDAGLRGVCSKLEG